jgi:hypothetical protein
MATFSSLTITDVSQDADKGAALVIVNMENERRAKTETELPLPTFPDDVLFESYVRVWETQICPNAHASYIRQAADQAGQLQNVQERWVISNDTQRTAAASELEPLA